MIEVLKTEKEGLLECFDSGEKTGNVMFCVQSERVTISALTIFDGGEMTAELLLRAALNAGALKGAEKAVCANSQIKYYLMNLGFEYDGKEYFAMINDIFKKCE